MNARILIAAGLVGCLGTFPVSAQISAQRGPIQIEADRLDVLDRENRAIYLGNVDAIQNDSRLRAKKLTVVFAASEPAAAGERVGVGAQFGDVEKLIAEGDVFYLTPGEKAKGDRGVYDYKSDTITLTGNVTVTRGENVIVGDTLEIRVSEGISTMSSNSKVAGQRVKTVIVPGNEGEAAATSEPADET